MALVEKLRPAPAPPPLAAADGIPEAARTRPYTPRQVFAATAIGAVVLAFLASSDLPSWAEQLGDGPLTPALRNAAIGWNRELEELGFTQPHQLLRRGLGWLRDRQWP
jgi:hypothetical protein